MHFLLTILTIRYSSSFKIMSQMLQFISLEVILSLRFLGGASTSICHFFRPCVSRASYLRNRTSSGHNFCYTCYKCVKRRYLPAFFSFFKILIFWAVRGVKVQKIAQNDKNFCLSLRIYGPLLNMIGFWYTFVK